jgi:hypothetical protein
MERGHLGSNENGRPDGQRPADIAIYSRLGNPEPCTLVNHDTNSEESPSHAFHKADSITDVGHLCDDFALLLAIQRQ